jgi:hypothetical protein
MCVCVCVCVVFIFIFFIKGDTFCLLIGYDVAIPLEI